MKKRYWIVILMLLNCGPIKGQQHFTNLSAFRFVHGFIITRAEANGEVGNYIVDTGSPELILNSNHFPVSPSVDRGFGLTGELNLFQSKLKFFKWNGEEWKKKEAYAIDLSHLENLLGIELHGLIGMDMLKHTALYIDYEARKIAAFQGVKAESLQEAEIVVPMTIQDGLPCMQLGIETGTFLFGIDSGALSNFVDSHSMSNLLTSEKQTDDIYLVRGLDATKRKVYSYRWDLLKVGKRTITVNMDFLAINLNDLHNEGLLKGILGLPFLAQASILLDFQNREVRFWLREVAVN